jgi:uncharacterized membrane protein
MRTFRIFRNWDGLSWIGLGFGCMFIVVVLFIVAIFGLIIFGGAYAYRQAERERTEWQSSGVSNSTYVAPATFYPPVE